MLLVRFSCQYQISFWLIVARAVIGDLDRLLPTRFSLPPLIQDKVEASLDIPPGNIILSDILIGTRLHRGEGLLLEAYTVSSGVCSFTSHRITL